ncbi:Nif3-like dinuclear metal center hexameric protein [Rubritalea tangerina]|uniref:Nif3-like dinuclear metal center hexameric protein n=1 Tax=Rubritalea tangerina TaxID=430798 RepID=A0ABW4ZCD8_9BACT
MAELHAIESYLEEMLKTSEVPDYGAAHNGLQLTNNGEVTKVVAAVDASLPVIRKAINEGADLLIVHHGLFWQGVQKMVGAQYEKFAEAIHANLAIYSSHIPLDIHPEFGNNALLAQSIGMEKVAPFHDWKEIQLGLKQELDLDFETLIERVEAAVEGDVHFCRGRKEPSVGTVGIVTGGAGSEIMAMAEQGVDTFITGEGPHWSYPLAEELGVNLLYAGHYATETFGVKALAEQVAKKWDIATGFIDHPTGL